jgi:hypothetical protein
MTSSRGLVGLWGGMPVSDDPTVSGTPGQDPGNQGYLGGGIPVVAGGILHGGYEGKAPIGSCPPTDYPLGGWALYLFSAYILDPISNGVSDIHTGIAAWGQDNFGLGSDFTNDRNNTFSPRIASSNKGQYLGNTHANLKRGYSYDHTWREAH